MERTFVQFLRWIVRGCRVSAHVLLSESSSFSHFNGDLHYLYDTGGADRTPLKIKHLRFNSGPCKSLVPAWILRS